MILKSNYSDERPQQYRYERCKHFSKGIMHLPLVTQVTLNEMFSKVQIAFRKLSSDRNLISFKYIAYKLLEILDEHEYKQTFKLIKTKERLCQLDMIWRNICKECEWNFILTV